MRFKLIILLALIGLASARALVAYQLGPVSFSGCNCRGDGDPNPVEVSIFVANPSPLPLMLSYEFYDPSINLYRQGSWIKCYGNNNMVSPYSSASCAMRIYTMMGGLNGTSNINVILIGTDGVDNYTTSFDVQVSYHTSPFEVNLLSRLQDAEHDYNRLANAVGKDCYGDSCCGMLAVGNYIGLASGNLSAATLYLRECQLSSSWSYIMDVSNSVRAANQSFTQLKNNCTMAVSLINSTGLRIASVAKVILEGKKCGSNVTLSQLQLSSANSSLNEAVQALASDDYTLAFSKLRDANSSIYSSVNSIGKCPSGAAPPPIVTPTKQNSTNSFSNQTSSGDNTLLILGGAFVALLVIVAVAFVALTVIRTNTPRREELPKAPPAAPPAQPPAAPPPAHDVHEDLEKEFNEWLGSHSQKK
ncbi:hypothetical protein H0N99_02790 [Candidatus Micrarchaeota archaeon]|nr:hypothetical protein [Candidatus Micrarchaeota archaeon]